MIYHIPVRAAEEHQSVVGAVLAAGAHLGGSGLRGVECDGGPVAALVALVVLVTRGEGRGGGREDRESISA
jgi:hypothetical protein